MNGETLFLSRAGSDAAISEAVAGVLERAGYDVILQQRSFVNKSFIYQMQTALASGARVIALLSPDYLASDYCSAEWQSVLADDPLNKKSRLVVLRIVECVPAGLLRALTYWDLVSAHDPKLFEKTVLDAVAGTQSTPAPRTPALLPAVAEPPEAALAGNLPLQLTAFIGRARVLTEIKVVVETSRLVTLLGPGGLGKTRTALQVAADLQDGTGDGVWFVDLAPVGTSAFVIAQLASVFDVREEAGTPLLETVLAHLGPKRLLLILDNCEHVIDAARDLADAIVRRCPDVRIIATTREALGIDGEAVYRLPTLGVPRGGERLEAEEALRYEAVALFVTRARAADSRFAITDTNAATIAEICRRLDGIALAIELAAPRIKILSLTQLAAKIDERFRLLTGGGKTVVPRQQTMRALIDWSYDLLDPGEQRLFRRLAIFSGGWTLEAATAICDDDETDEFAILDRLTSLSDKSLVVVDFNEEAQRFRLLESMRAYGLERMRDAGEFESLARKRAAYFADAAGDGSRIGSAILTRLAAVEAEIDNLREVLTWALQQRHDVELGARLALALGRFWSTKLPREGQRWLELARDALGENPDLALMANLTSALAAMLAHGSFERFELTQRALEIARSAGDRHTLSKALSAYGEQLTPVGRRDEARTAFEEALASARAAGSEWDTARALAGLCMLAVDGDDVAAARELGHQAIVLFEALGAIDGVAYVSIALGQAEFKAGNLERAVSLTRRARSAYGELNNNRSSACAGNYLAAFALEADDFEEARRHARDTLDLLRTDRHPIFLTEAIGHLALIATVSGNPARGSLLQGYVGAAFRRVAHQPGSAIEPCYLRHERLLARTVDADSLKQRLAEGASLSEERAMEEALAACESQADGAIAT